MTKRRLPSTRKVSKPRQIHPHDEPRGLIADAERSRGWTYLYHPGGFLIHIKKKTAVDICRHIEEVELVEFDYGILLVIGEDEIKAFWRHHKYGDLDQVYIMVT